MYEKIYSQITDALVDDGYIVVEDVFENSFTENLLYRAKIEENFKSAGISASQNLHLDNKRRRDKIRWLDGVDEYEKEFLNFSEGLQTYLNRSLYLGLSYYEAHFAIYEKGDFYEKHFDSFKHSKNRVVTTVFYLDKCDAGELIIYDKSGEFLKKITPQQNKLIVFMSENFPHEVLVAKSKRYSIAGWFRIDKN